MHHLQKKLLEKIQSNDFSEMTLREIGELVGESHPQKIKHHLDQLKQKGYIRESSDGGIVRSTVDTGEFIHIPIRGRANCGEAMVIAEDQVEGYLTVSKGTISGNAKGLYILKAVGESMNQANVGSRSVPIHDGDYIVVSGDRRVPRNGDYVVSIIDGAANVKKFKQDQERVVLMSESTQNYPPIIIAKSDYDPGYFIAGEVVDVIRGV